ncbi:MAG: MFS transporter [Anaerolineaceae bacterium]|nr:MFS transporter [Anaerolineaceae bacterium]
MKTPALFTTLKNFSGNPRGCVYTEPLWGIPFTLFTPFASIYMIAIGLNDSQIGSIVSISWGFQIVLALFSGVITDKLGRRKTTLIFDIIGWSVFALISAFAQNFWYFLAAGVVNSFWRVTQNSWTCLLVEDADPGQIVDMFTWIQIFVQFVGFFAPLAGLLVSKFSLIPTVRGLYLFAAFMFSLKAIITYIMTEETQQGIIRMHETKHESIFIVLKGYQSVLTEIVKTPQTLVTAAIMVMISITGMINGSFWAILVTEKLHFSAESLSFFPLIKSTIILLFFFTVMPVIKRMHFKYPMIIGLIGYVLSQLLLILSPEKSYLLVILSLIVESCSFATVTPLLDQMVVNTINPKERARIQSILYVGIITLTAPFGWIAGQLSEIDKSWPFILNISLFAIAAVLAAIAGNISKKQLEKIPVIGLS